MKKVTFIYEPSEENLNSELFMYTTEGYEGRGHCNRYTAEVLKTQNKILDLVNSLPVTEFFKEDIIQMIEDYGDARAENAFYISDVNYAEMNQ